MRQPDHPATARPGPRGGTSSMNAMVWIRGTRIDYDGWDLPAGGLVRCRAGVPTHRSHYLGGPTHGTSGPVRITRLPEPDVTSIRWLDSARAAGVSANEDIGGPDLDGSSIAPVTVWKGQRWNTARAYLPAAPPTFKLRGRHRRPGPPCGVARRPCGGCRVRAQGTSAHRQRQQRDHSVGRRLRHAAPVATLRNRRRRPPPDRRNHTRRRKSEGRDQSHRSSRGGDELGCARSVRRTVGCAKSHSVAALDPSPDRKAHQQCDGGHRAGPIRSRLARARLPADPLPPATSTWWRWNGSCVARPRSCSPSGRRRVAAR